MEKCVWIFREIFAGKSTCANNFLTITTAFFKLEEENACEGIAGRERLMIYTVTFNPALDYIVTLQELCTGGLNRVAAEQLLPGGKGINVSLVLKNLGHENTALGFLAGFTGNEIKRRLEEMGICTDFIEIKQGNSRINVKIMADKETELNAAGPPISREETEELFGKLDKIQAGDFLVLAGSIPASLPDTIYESIMRQMEGRGIRMVVDAEGELLKKVLKYKPFLVKPNKREISMVCGRRVESRQEIAWAAGRLKEEGAQNVLVSMAEEGALLLDEYGRYHDRKAVKGTVINSVGAGDSMVAGFLAGFLETGDYEKALCMGTAAGSASAFSRYLATRAETEALMTDSIGR